MEREIKKVNTKQLTVIHDASKGPTFLPNNPAQKESINGKKINNKYINDFQIINLKSIIIHTELVSINKFIVFVNNDSK